MTSVERVKEICRERKIPISKLEKDLGYANGYVSQLRKGVFPDARLSDIARYLSVSIAYLATGEMENPAPSVESGIDAEIIGRLCQLTPAELEKVDAFVQGLLASR